MSETNSKASAKTVSRKIGSGSTRLLQNQVTLDWNSIKGERSTVSRFLVTR